MMIPSQPLTTFEVIEAQFLLQLAVVHLNPPTRMSHSHQSTQTRQAGTQLGQPVLRRLGFPLGPFHPQPFTDPLGSFLCAPAEACPYLQACLRQGLMTATVTDPCLV